MKLLDWKHFNMPAVFRKINFGEASPPKVGSMETRPVADALDCPRVTFYNPDGLHFRPTDWATPKAHSLPTNGGYQPAGLGMVVYDHQATWDREQAYLADGITRHFFTTMMNDNRIKHI